MRSTSDTRQRQPARWKIIIAPHGPWRGEMYPSRAGTDRRQFASAVDLCTAFLATTGWALPHRRPDDQTAGRLGARHTADRPPSKIVVVADEPWQGALYTTTGSGPGRLEFDGFEQFFRAVVDTAGWSVD